MCMLRSPYDLISLFYSFLSFFKTSWRNGMLSKIKFDIDGDWLFIGSESSLAQYLRYQFTADPASQLSYS